MIAADARDDDVVGPCVVNDSRVALSASWRRHVIFGPVMVFSPFAQARGERLLEYLKRVLLCAAPLNNPRDVAWFLASYARDARARVDAGE